MTRAIELLTERLHVTRWRGETADAQCPAHGDTRASLTFGPGDNGGAVLHCHAGCSVEQVLAAVGMTLRDLSPTPHIVARYQYQDERGVLAWTVERWEPKDFRVRPGLPPPGERLLFHSEYLNQARATGARAWIVEGEKDALTLLEHGELAFCGVGGAGTWLPQYSDQLAGLDVTVVADADEPGRTHARAVARALDGKAARVSLVEPSFGKDITDQLTAGYDLDTVIPLPVEETLGVHRADRVRERQIAWLWPGYIPMGKLVIVDGDPGDGKSVMTCDLAARFSTGAPLPDGTPSPLGPCDVVMISAEDDPEDTIRPRLRLAGADLTRVHMVTAGTVPNFPFDLGRDMPALELFVAEHHVKLLVIDPIMAFISSQTDAHRDADVRRLLHPLVRMAARTGCAVVVVRHLTKGRTKAVYAGGGSIAFVGAARVGFLVGVHPFDETRRVLSCVKINVGQRPHALGYKVISSVANPSIPVVAWDSAPLEMSAQELLDGEDATDERDGREMARDFLNELLCANHSGMRWPDIVKAGRREDHSEATLRRIRKQVAKVVRNPIDIDGNRRDGAWWFHVGQKIPTAAVITHGDDDAPLAHPVPPVTDPFLSTNGTHSDTPELPGPGPCDVCGGTPAVAFGDPWFVRRCLPHHPQTYRG